MPRGAALLRRALQSLGRGAGAQSKAGAWLAAAMHASPLRLFAPVVEVPPMGDSISEGTVAEVLKQPGDAVAADEVLAQIETDKVTIDVRAPVGGVVKAVLVKDGDNVVVGQAVADITEDANAAAAAGSAAAQAPAAAPKAPPPPPPPPAPAQLAAAAAASAATPHRTPRIAFPPRLLPDGTRISDLSRAQQGALAGAAAPPRARSTAAGGVLPPSMPDMTEEEMEIVNLGGCLP